MLSQIKLTVAKPATCETAKDFSGMLGGVFLQNAEVKCHSAKFKFGQFFADVELRVVDESLATASVNQWDVHVDILRAVLDTSKDAQQACITLAELHILKVLTEGLFR